MHCPKPRVGQRRAPALILHYHFCAFSGISIILAIPIVITYLETGLVPRLSTAILSTGLMLSAFLSLACGLILETVRLENKRMRYLSIPAVDHTR